MLHTFGIIQPESDCEIPGTYKIVDGNSLNPELLQQGTILKKGSGANADVVLIPQPSDDPNDPLNWTSREKQIVLWTVAVASAFVHTLGPAMNTSFQAIAKEFHQPMDRVTQAVSGNFALTAGVGTIFVSAFGICYGKRPAFLASAVASSAICVWIIFEKSFKGFTAARVLQGVATAPLEVLAAALVSDIFCVHERGKGLAVVGAMHHMSTLLSQIVGGFVVQYLGWRRLYLVEACILAALVPLVFFLLPETSWVRKDLPQVEKHSPPEVSVGEPSPRYTVHDPYEMRILSREITQSRNEFSPTAAMADRALVQSRSSGNQFVLFGVFVHGLGSTWLFAFAFAKLKLFSAAPYHMKPSQIGLTVLPGAATSILGQVAAGYLSDWLVKKLAKRNNGMYEAEYRLFLMIPQAIFSVAGFAGFGITISQGRPLWIVLSFFSLVTLSVPFGSLASLTYLVDSLPKRSQEALVTTIAIKAIFVLIFASLINGYIDRFGARNVFVSLGLLNLAISVWTIPFYIYGKVMRRAMVKSAVLQKLDQW